MSLAGLGELMEIRDWYAHHRSVESIRKRKHDTLVADLRTLLRDRDAYIATLEAQLLSHLLDTSDHGEQQGMAL